MYLTHKPDDALLLAKGFTFGFCLHSVAKPRACFPPNLLSVRVNHGATLAKLNKELALGRMAGPFGTPPFSDFICSPLGLVPKTQPGEFRLIHHLSYPKGDSVNDGIDGDLCKVHYASFDQAVALVQTAGCGAFLAKADIQSAFRLLPVHPDDFHRLGFHFGGKFYFDMCLPMGCSISCSLFETFSRFLEFFVVKDCCDEGAFVTHYLDDFLFVGKDVGACTAVADCFLRLCTKLGVPLAADKSEGPTRRLSYLGLEIDASLGLVRVPFGKIVVLRTELATALGKSKLTLREVQRLIGLLNFVCRAISPGRAFLRRLVDLTVGVSCPHHKVRIGKGARADLFAWSQFLADFNGVSLFLPQQWWDSPDLQLFTDAAASIGFGAIFEGKWFQGHWPAGFTAKSPSIAACEFVPVVVAVLVWAPLLASKRILFWCDNQAVVSIINKQTSKCPLIMPLVRLLVLRCLEFNILFKAKYVPGLENGIADSLSRFQLDRFRLLAPFADPTMTVLPSLHWLS